MHEARRDESLGVDLQEAPVPAPGEGGVVAEEGHRCIGARCTLTLVGKVEGLVIATPEEAEEHNWYAGEGIDFEPFLAVDNIEFLLDHDVLQFLVDVQATFDTHISAELRSSAPPTAL